jgi:hypothetical protein
MNDIERNGHVLLADSEKAANRDHESVDFALLVEKNISSDLGVRRIINVLLVVGGDDRGILRSVVRTSETWSLC